MSEDEIFVTFLCSALTLVFWGFLWYLPLATVTRIGPTNGGRATLWWMPPAGLLFNLIMLKLIAASDVRDDGAYLFMYSVMGAAWTGVLMRLCLPVLGLSVRDDVIERGNSAAAVMIWCVGTGLSLAFLGANAGEGPGWSVVVGSALLSTLLFFLAWAGMQIVGRTEEEVTVNRSMATAVRAGGLLIAVGLVLGRSVAGDWVSSDDLVQDCGATAWPVLFLIIADWAMSLLTRTRPGDAEPSVLLGVFAAIVNVGLAGAYVIYLGPWS